MAVTLPGGSVPPNSLDTMQFGSGTYHWRARIDSDGNLYVRCYPTDSGEAIAPAVGYSCNVTAAWIAANKPESYDAPRLAYLHKTLPGLTVRTAETGPVDYTTPACAPMAAALEQGCRDISFEDDEERPFASL